MMHLIVDFIRNRDLEGAPCFFDVDAYREPNYNIIMSDENKKLTESEEIDMILYGKVIDRSDWVYTTESEEYEEYCDENDLM